MIGSKPASDFVLSYNCRSCPSSELVPVYRPMAEGRRPGSLGSEAGREWALRKLVGAWPPQAERARPVERGSHFRWGTEIYSSLSFSLPLSLGLSAAWLALSFNR